MFINMKYNIYITFIMFIIYEKYIEYEYKY